jgi:hypothetical protein
MEKNVYTGEMASALSLMALVSAMGSANLMARKPDMLLDKMLVMVGQRVKERAPQEAIDAWNDPMFREIMREFVGQCGLTTMATLQVYRKFVTVCQQNKNAS